MVRVRSPLSLRMRDDGRRQVVEAQRRRADRVAHVAQAAQDVLDVGVIAQRNRHQAGLRRMGAGRLCQRQDAFGRKRAHRQVVVAGPAEPAQVRAPAHHLDQEARAELGVGREDGGRRRVHGFGGLERRLAHHRRRAGAFARHVARDGAVGGVLHVVERRDVVAAGLGQPLQLLAPRRGRHGVDQGRHQRFAFAGRDHVREHRERFGVDERHRAADHDQRVLCSRGRPRAAARRPAAAW